jgi:hypothetical protein
MTGLALKFARGPLSGYPRNGGPAAPRVGSENTAAHSCGLLSVQETGCGTPERNHEYVWSRWTICIG